MRQTMDALEAFYRDNGPEFVESEQSVIYDERGHEFGGTFDEVAAARGDEPVADEAATAVHRAIDEIGRIEDPHRAIDWLSTLPQVALAALGEAA